ncbi:hypothetical protein SARC_01748 [Sphaeroforma arctica JP610]|uniref:Ribosomal protein L39e n=1 Tax=Sphaeroforma arctica JP610 TaxID=667725 RepID=A0A0L0GB18_9EUKA|nr:hypothetical protein SARC_01748 [Sphaeroforma arctica JP610]KNC86089.1 hypothetical protein SARC_01748 [Sphaeroforma arctica JP610]|eukprot:XP_014159991.1 hypothetical protein SARC_01748 [Sphaeroforma arctica JP610]
MPSHKTTIIKTRLAKAAKQNRPLPNWIRMKTGNTIRAPDSYLAEEAACFEFAAELAKTLADNTAEVSHYLHEQKICGAIIPF